MHRPHGSTHRDARRGRRPADVTTRLGIEHRWCCRLIVNSNTFSFSECRPAVPRSPLVVGAMQTSSYTDTATRRRFCVCCLMLDVRVIERYVLICSRPPASVDPVSISRHHSHCTLSDYSLRQADSVILHCSRLMLTRYCACDVVSDN